MSTSSGPESAAARPAPGTVATAPPAQDAAVFAEPWQAQAFALAVRLSASGCFTWNEWTEQLAGQIAAAASRSDAPDDGSDYHHHWLAALERLLVDKGIASAAALHARRHAWEDAYRRTRHGQPVPPP